MPLQLTQRRTSIKQKENRNPMLKHVASVITNLALKLNIFCNFLLQKLWHNKCTGEFIYSERQWYHMLKECELSICFLFLHVESKEVKSSLVTLKIGGVSPNRRHRHGAAAVAPICPRQQFASGDWCGALVRFPHMCLPLYTGHLSSATTQLLSYCGRFFRCSLHKRGICFLLRWQTVVSLLLNFNFSILEYFRKLDEGLHKKVRDQTSPVTSHGKLKILHATYWDVMCTNHQVYALQTEIKSL